MTTELAIFAARLREFIGLCMAEPLYGAPNPAPVWREHCDAEFNGMALTLFALQSRYNPAYRKFCEARGATPASVNHWMQIPAVPAAAFKELEMTCIPVAERCAVFHSSGTTEQTPSRHFHCADSLATYEASLWPWFARNVPGDSRADSNFRLFILAPPPGEAPHSSLAHMFETVRRKMGSRGENYFGRVTEGVWELDLEATMWRLSEACAEGNPAILLGTAFLFVHLLDFLATKDRRLSLPKGSRVMETGGYKNRSRSLPKAELHGLITDRLGVPPAGIVCEYGMSELSSQAYDNVTSDEWRVARLAEALRPSSPVSRHFHFPPWARGQIVSPETGQEVPEGGTGRVRVFDLANVYSVMALQTEDLGVRDGDGFELMGRAQLAEARGCSLMTA